jgi:tryptophan synthase alpha chain
MTDHSGTQHTTAAGAVATTTRELRGSAAIGAALARARAAGRCALITYLTLGYPSLEDTLRLVLALQAGGADLIELGVPFSDPVADGPAIQRASLTALQHGVTPEGCLKLTARLRESGVSVPLLLMGYYNPIHHYGVERYARACVAAGADGLIVPDLPPEEAQPLREACLACGLAMVFLVAPTSGESRIAQIAAASTGFLYVISRLGTTGAGLGPDPELADRLALVRRHAHTPVAVGFGISRPEDARALAAHADGIIVGSAVVERAPQGPDAICAYVASLRDATIAP